MFFPGAGLRGSDGLRSVRAGRSLALGSYVLASKLAGAVYDGHATDSGMAGSDSDSQPLTCTGRACFGLTYMISAVLCAIAAVLMARCDTDHRVFPKDHKIRL